MPRIPPQHRRFSDRVAPLWRYGLLIVLTLMISVHAGTAQETAQFGERLRALEIAHQATQVNLDTLWVGVASILVFGMQAGFVILAMGVGHHPPSSETLTKRLITLGGITLAFWAIGFGLMFGRGSAWMGETGWFLNQPR